MCAAKEISPLKEIQYQFRFWLLKPVSSRQVDCGARISFSFIIKVAGVGRSALDQCETRPAQYLFGFFV